MDDNVEVKVRKVVAEHLGIENSALKIASETTFDELGADSLDQVEIVMALEEEFNIEINDEEYEEVKTLGESVKLVKSKL